jgi:hypothetical protein
VNFQETKRPEISAFMLVAILVGGILSALGGGDLVNFVTGCVLIGGGCWATCSPSAPVLASFKR